MSLKPFPPNRIHLFKELAKFNESTGTSRTVCTTEFTGPYEDLKITNGGGWCRLDHDFGCLYKVCTIKRNGETRFSWHPTDAESDQITAEMKGTREFTKGTNIYLIKMCGYNDLSSGRPIRQDIRNALKDGPCVSCGTSSKIEIDHKNGLYNDPRVLCVQGQTIDDFQSLCKHCNDLKRQTYVWSKRMGRRYGATSIPSLRVFGIDFVQGDENYDPSDPNATVGTYWHDPVSFMRNIFNIVRKGDK